MLGFIDEPTKIQALDSSIALVLPSIADHVEVYSIVTSEAWARGKPVIASSIGELPYRIKNYVNGILVKPLNPKILADSMLELVDNSRLAEEMGKNGRERILSWEEIAIRSIKLYQQVYKTNE